MTNKGTGWVPDFPDVKDYTLNSKQIQALTNQVQTDRSMESVEDLTEQFSQALKLLTSQQFKASEGANPEDANDETSKKLKGLIEKLDKKVAGGIYFVPTKIHNKILRPGMSDPEILKAKRCLQSIYPEVFKKTLNENYAFDITYDAFTESLISDFKTSMRFPNNGIVDSQTMNALLQASKVKKNMRLFEATGYDAQYSTYRGYLSWEEITEISSLLQAIHESGIKLRAIRNNTFEEVKSIIRTAVNHMKICRERVKAILENHENIRLTPIVEEWLSSDEKEKGLLYSEVPLEDWVNSATETNSGTTYTFSYSLNVVPVGQCYQCILHVTGKICEIPCFLKLKTVPKIKNIPAVIPDQFFEGLLKKIISTQEFDDFNQLMKPINSTIFKSMSSVLRTGARDYLSLVVMLRKVEKDREKLIKQLTVLGIRSDPQSSLMDRMASFEQQLHQFIRMYSLEDGYLYDSSGKRSFNYDSIFEYLVDAIQQKLYQLIYPIAKAVYQIIMPIGQYSNLEQAIEQGLESFNSLIQKTAKRQKNNDTTVFNEEHQRLTEENLFNEIDAFDNAAYLESICLTAMLEVVENLEKESDSQVHRMIRKFVESYQLSIPIEKEVILDKDSPQKPFLQLLNTSSVGSHTQQADLQIPVNWNLYQSIKARNSGELAYFLLPDLVDLSLWCSSIEDQGEINSCTAQAGVALTEYFAKKSSGKYIDVSSLFLYKAARNLMQREGDTGASVRETMKAMVLFGIPPEEYWPYNEENYDQEPTSFCYSFAQNYQAIKYFRLDYAGIANDTLLIQVKAVLIAGFPCMFGFTIYTSIHEEPNIERGYIPYPNQFDKMEGGHAVVAVGYDDHRIIENADGKQSEGAILIRNSWGTDWGEGGYGWLPYDYVLAGLTADWWSLFQSEWFESGKFGVGATHWKSGMGGNRKGW